MPYYLILTRGQSMSALASIDRIEKFLREHDAPLIIQHDPQDIGALGALPATLR